MREFPGAAGNVGFDRFEHGAENTGVGSRKPEGKTTLLSENAAGLNHETHKPHETKSLQRV
jgi:hypothetical protein